jgi:hypothetical protein
MTTYPIQRNIQFIFDTLAATKGIDDESEYYIFGGWPRDMLRGETPNDIDVWVSNHNHAMRYKRMLHTFGILVSSTVDLNSQYAVHKLQVRAPTNEILNIDLVTDEGSELSRQWSVIADFTMNNLIFLPDGTIRTRIPRLIDSDNVTHDGFLFTMECIRDAIQGNLKWIVPKFMMEMYTTKKKYITNPNGEQFRTSWLPKLIKRFEHMRSKGFIYKGTLTGFELKQEITVSHLKPNNDTTPLFCSICQETYCEDAKRSSSVLECGHHFHQLCITEWELKKSDCPLCRTKIKRQYLK